MKTKKILFKPTSIFLILFLWCNQLNTRAYAEQSQIDLVKDIPMFFLGAGDIVRVFVWNHPDLSLNTPINPNGIINYPLIGELKAAGITETDLEAAISRKISKHIKNPLVSVTLIELNSYDIYVSGEVMRSGLFSIKRPITVTQAIAMAGGFTPFANKNNILIVNRENGKRVHFDFKGFINKESVTSNIFLKPGDTVFVN